MIEREPEFGDIVPGIFAPVRAKHSTLFSRRLHFGWGRFACSGVYQVSFNKALSAASRLRDTVHRCWLLHVWPPSADQNHLYDRARGRRAAAQHIYRVPEPRKLKHTIRFPS